MPSSDRIIRSASLSRPAPIGAPAAAPLFRPVRERTAVPEPHVGQVLRGHVPRRAAFARPAALGPAQQAPTEAWEFTPPDASDADLRATAADAEARGYAAGQERAANELRDRLVAVGAFAAQLEAIAPHDAAVVAKLVVDLATTIAGRILDRQLEADPTLLVEIIERALRSVTGNGEARIHLHPSTVDPVRDAWQSTHGQRFLGRRWIFEADPTLPVGGCTIRHEHGLVETGLEVQLDDVRAALERSIPSLARPRGSRDEDGA